jgi:hypothetical protein
MRSAQSELSAQGVSQDQNNLLLRPFKELARGYDVRSSHLMFRSPNCLADFRLRLPLENSYTVAGCFSVRRVISELHMPDEFYILSLSKTDVELYRCDGFTLNRTGLPGGVSENIAEALALEPPDHTLVNRSAAGRSTGTMPGVRFGTGSERERRHAHLADFYKQVDRAIRPLLGDRVPLVLEGDVENVATYRGISQIPKLLTKAIHPNKDKSDALTHLLEEAGSILHADCLQAQARSLSDDFERTPHTLVSTDPKTILEASFAGRVRALYINESEEELGICAVPGYRSWGREDLLNLAAVQSILHHGLTYVVPGSTLPNGAKAVAFMRF